MKELYYQVAGHVFSLAMDEHDNIEKELQQYEPFAVQPTRDVAFSLQITDVLPSDDGFVEEFRQEDEGQEIVSGRMPDGRSRVEFWLRQQRSAILTLNEDYSKGKVYIEKHQKFGINNALMVTYALATANQRTALFHSSVVSYKGKAYMFLGVSGTGKSTHSSLWLKYIEGTELVNDDNPVVRILDNGDVWLYGSPWSGKTPCYRNVSYPLGALVNLSQAPENKIQRMKGVKAYVSLIGSISGKRWDPQVAEGLHETEKLLAENVPIWHLDCLPDEAAARLCCQTVSTPQ